jgi:hypothetical protein
MKLSRFVGSTVLFVGLSIAAENLSGSVITSGTIDLPGLGAGTFSLSGSGFTAAGNFDGAGTSNWPVITSCLACSPGFALPVNGTVIGNDFRDGSATIGATSFSGAWGDLSAVGGSNFTITGLPITVNAPGPYTGAFSFTGSLCGTNLADPAPRPCIANLPVLTGSGQVTVNIVASPIAGNPNLLRSASATYTFTPEPSSIEYSAIAALVFLVGRKALRAHRA